MRDESEVGGIAAKGVCYFTLPEQTLLVRQLRNDLTVELRPTIRGDNSADGDGGTAPLKRNAELERNQMNPCIWESGNVTNAVISELVSLLRFLLCCHPAWNSEWKDPDEEGVQAF